MDSVMAEESTRVTVRVSPEREEEISRKRKVVLLRQFKNLAPKFKGDEGLEVAEDFISELEKIFEILGCTPEEKLLMAEYSLQRGADSWWKAIKDSDSVIHTGDAWTAFKIAFLEKYFPFSYHTDKALEFANLTQEGMTVDEYDSMFAALSRYGPLLDAESRARKFELGLEPEIRLRLAAFMLTSYEDICRRAQIIEKELMAVREEESKGWKRMTGNMSGLSLKKKFRSGGAYSAPRQFITCPPRTLVPAWSFCRGGSHGSRSVGPPICPRCHRNNFGCTCGTSETICYRCGRPGHIRRNCPRGGDTSRSSMAGTKRARFNAVTEADANASHEVISDK
ncbi:hypothetical protein MLD38_037802 [Melastoma candidum]|uniref:Uncharacterized protein n=1 Tax=Melastoma candidum TaxID=119954 RepID=A0ACB9LPH8_9MYRT|nr:hypothetical protein MLD38_037802 [Melastoma candidum]